MKAAKSRERLEVLLQEATGKEMSYADFLDCVLTEEVVSRRRTPFRPPNHRPAHPTKHSPLQARVESLTLGTSPPSSRGAVWPDPAR
jgi:hypothetical protein